MGGNAAVHFGLHFLPGGVELGQRRLQLGRPVGGQVERHLPFLQILPLQAQHQLLAFACALGHRVRRGRCMRLERRIQRRQRRCDGRVHALINRVDLGIVGNAFERDVRHRLVDEAAAQPLMRVAQRKVVKAGRHQPLLGQRDGHARGIAGDPAAAPFLGDVGRGAGTAGGV